jgi:hypothetical protein
MSTLLRFRIKISILGIPLAVFFLYHLLMGLISVPQFILLNPQGVASFYKFLQLGMLIFAFYNFQELTKKPYELLFNYFVRIAVLFVIIGTLGYFYELPIWINFRPWFGRFSSGYPTMDVISLSYALSLLLFYDNLRLSLIKRILYTILVIIGIVLQVTGTGFISLILIICTFILYAFTKSSKQKILRLSGTLSIFIILIFALSIVNTFKVMYPEEYDQAEKIALNKFYSFFDKNEVEESLDTNLMRQDQLEHAKQFQENMFQKVLGIGLGRLNMDTLKDQNRNEFYHIEDQYSINLIAYGYVGSLFFILFILNCLLGSIKSKHVDINIRFLLFICAIIYTINNMTLITLYLFSNTAAFALIYAFSRKIKTEEYASISN